MSNFFLDPNTLAFALMLVTGLMASVMFFVWRAQKTYPGTQFWVLSNLAGTIAFLLVSFRDIGPEILTVVIGNTLGVATTALALEGNRRFLGLKPRSSIAIGLMSVYFLTQVYHTYVSPDFASRIFSASLIVSLLAFLSYMAFNEKPGLMENVVYRTVGRSFLLFAILMFVRMIAVLAFSEFYSPDWIQSVSYMVFLIFAVVWGFNYMVLNSERMHEELREKESELLERATTDFLTGLGNKRTFEEFARAELKRSRRYNIPTVLILIDLDHFKNINDTYGHAVGDKVLAQIGALLKKMTRQHDRVARLGGEEFGLLLTHTDLNAAQVVANAFRREIEKVDIRHSGHKISITSSFGVALLADEDSFESLMERADTNLYKAKRLGRNRVISETIPNLRLISKTQSKKMR